MQFDCGVFMIVLATLMSGINSVDLGVLGP